MLGFEAAGAAPIVKNEVVPNPETVATAIRIGNPASWELAVEARDDSGGTIESVTDEGWQGWRTREWRLVERADGAVETDAPPEVAPELIRRMHGHARRRRAETGRA